MSKLGKGIVVVILTKENMEDMTVKKPRDGWWFMDALGNYVFLRNADKDVCEDYTKSNYGTGKYTLKPVKLTKTKGVNTLKSSINSKSRAGDYYRRISERQGF